MALATFKLGQRVILDKVTLRMSRKLPNGNWLLENMETGQFTELGTTALLTAWNETTLTFLQKNLDAVPANKVKDLVDIYGDNFRQKYSDKSWERALAKHVFVQNLLKAPVTKALMVPMVEEVYSNLELWKKVKRPEKCPSWNSVAGWLRKFKHAGKDIRVLVDRKFDRGNHEERYHSDVLEIIDDLIDSRFLTEERPTRADILEDIRGRVERLNKDLPAECAHALPGICVLKSRITMISAFDRYAARHGDAAARMKFRACRDGIPAKAPLERVEMDHCKLDFFVIDESTGLPLGRPWLTLLIDTCTRCIVGFYIGFEEPSNVSTARGIRNAIAPKHDLLATVPGIVNTWDAWGVIDRIIADNGPDFHGETIEAGCFRYGMKLQFCTRKKAWFKAKVERFFRTLGLKLIGNLSGKTFESIFMREDYDPAKHATITLGTLRMVVLKWIVDYYHQRPHRGLKKMTPSMVWAEKIVNTDQMLPESSVLLDCAFSKLDTRRLTKDGIEMDCLFYQSDDLRRVRERFGSEITVQVQIMDDDLGFIIVAEPESNNLLKVFAVDQDYAAGMTRWQHKVVKNYQQLRATRDGTYLKLLEAKEAIRELIARDVQLFKKRTRQKQARFMGNGPLVPNNVATPATPSPTRPMQVTDTDYPKTSTTPSTAQRPPPPPRYAPVVTPPTVN